MTKEEYAIRKHLVNTAPKGFKVGACSPSHNWVYYNCENCGKSIHDDIPTTKILHCNCKEIKKRFDAITEIPPLNIVCPNDYKKSLETIFQKKSISKLCQHSYYRDSPKIYQIIPNANIELFLSELFPNKNLPYFPRNQSEIGSCPFHAYMLKHIRTYNIPYAFIQELRILIDNDQSIKPFINKFGHDSYWHYGIINNELFWAHEDYHLVDTVNQFNKTALPIAWNNALPKMKNEVVTCIKKSMAENDSKLEVCFYPQNIHIETYRW